MELLLSRFVFPIVMVICFQWSVGWSMPVNANQGGMTDQDQRTFLNSNAIPVLKNTLNNEGFFTFPEIPVCNTCQLYVSGQGCFECRASVLGCSDAYQDSMVTPPGCTDDEEFAATTQALKHVQEQVIANVTILSYKAQALLNTQPIDQALFSAFLLQYATLIPQVLMRTTISKEVATWTPRGPSPTHVCGGQSINCLPVNATWEAPMNWARLPSQ